MQGWTFRACLLFFIVLPQLVVFAESSDHDAPISGPGPLVRRSGQADPFSLDQIKDNVRESQTAGTAAWWKSVEALLDKLSTADASAFTEEIAYGKRQNLFRFANKARQSSAAALKEMTRNTGAPEARDAAAIEMERRLQDPTTAFLADAFSIRPERALEFAEELKDAGDDLEKLAKALARHMGPLNRAQRLSLLGAASAANGEEMDKALIDRIGQAANVSLGGAADNDFKIAFKRAFDGVQTRNREFEQLLSSALSGDAPSREALVKQFGKDALLDFVSAKLRNGQDGLAVDLAKTLARKDAQGNLFLDLDPDNAALTSDTKGQSLFLGNENANEGIRAALTAFDSSNATDHGDTLSFDPKTQGRLQQVSLGNSPAEDGRRFFASRAPTGEPTLTALPAGQTAPEEAATNAIENPNQLPPAKPFKREPLPEPPPRREPEKPAGLTDGDAKALIDRKCSKCHGEGKATVPEPFLFSQKDLNNPTVLKQIATAIQRPGNRAMPKTKEDAGFAKTKEGLALLAWLKKKTQ